MRRLAATLVLAACGGGPATLTEIQTQVFTPSCSNFSTCHQGSGAGGLDLEAGKTFAQLVSQPAVGISGKIRVKPGDAAGSYLMEKLTQAVPAAGVQMPNNGDPLEPAQLDLIRSWINAGAQNN